MPEAEGEGGSGGIEAPGEQHRGPAQRAGEGGREPWPWVWRMAGSVGERVKELWRAEGGGRLARPGERKEAEEERIASCPEGLPGAPFPREASCGLETAGDGAAESRGSRRGSVRLRAGSTGSSGSSVPAAQRFAGRQGCPHLPAEAALWFSSLGRCAWRGGLLPMLG